MKRVLKWLAGIAGRRWPWHLLRHAGRRRQSTSLLTQHRAGAVRVPLVIAGLSSPVEVVRDREGVPHIFAKTIDDLYCALGFVHAQDRLWQMELQRRTGQGRLSEIFGERTFGTDVFLRTLDLYGHAERSLAALPPEARARARGLCARRQRLHRAQRSGWLEPRLPPEFLLLRHRPEPWRPADSIVDHQADGAAALAPTSTTRCCGWRSRRRA